MLHLSDTDLELCTILRKAMAVDATTAGEPLRQSAFSILALLSKGKLELTCISPRHPIIYEAKMRHCRSSAKASFRTEAKYHH